MFSCRIKPVLLVSSLAVLGGFVVPAAAKLTNAQKEMQSASIESLRKSDGTITFKNGTTPLAGAEVKIEQIRHHFGFGGAVNYENMYPDTADSNQRHVDGDAYRAAVKKYFEWVTPGNCQKWPATNPDAGPPNFNKPDSVIAWCKENNIKVRGHNLFWNQTLKWMPEWVNTIAAEKDYAAGKSAIDKRIKECMTHYKGQCEHWDIINELIHGEVDGGNGKTIGTLEALTGDPGIYAYVLKEAAKYDADTKFTLNDYNMVSYWSDRSKYFTAVKQLINQGCKVDIVGCEGHFGTVFDQSDFLVKINDIAKTLDREIWMTEVDFNVPAGTEVKTIDELMSACFAHPNIGGVVLWAIWEGSLWRELNSFVIDLQFKETPLGAKWREKIAEWTTNVTATTDANGQISFKGFQGTYTLAFTFDGHAYSKTINLEPGAAQQFSVAVDQLVNTDAPSRTNFVNRTLIINNSAISFQLPISETRQLYLSAFSLSGKLLANVPVSFYDGIGVTENMPAGCHIYRIGTDQQIYHTAMGLHLR